MNPEKIQEAYAKKRELQAKATRAKQSKDDRDKALLGSDLIQKAVLKSASAQIEAMATHEPKVEVKNLGEAVDAINKLNLTNFTTSQPRIADMVENLENLSKEMADLSEKFKSIGFAPVSNALTQLLKQIDGLPKKISNISVKVEKDSGVEKVLEEINTNIKNIELNPQVEVKVPDIRVPKIDVSSIVNAIKENKVEEKEGIDFECYKAQDIDSDDPAFQYIGFVNPEGGWYIIENDIQGNSLRYAFGNTEYPLAWSRHSELEYKVLNEAVSVIQT